MFRTTRPLFVLAAAGWLAWAAPRFAAAKAKDPSSASVGSIDVNSASQKDLEALPGVGSATAKKIIAGRPYASVSDLSRAGLSPKAIEKLTPLVTAGNPAAAGKAPAASAKPAGHEKGPVTSASGAVDLNRASQKELEALPGVGPATAKKIIAGRPYSSPEDLARAGLSEKEIQKVTPLVKVDAAAGAPATLPEGKPLPAPEKKSTGKSAAPPAGAPVDLNTASQKDLEALPGVGPATAKKIVAGRPYASVADLSRAGVSPKTIEKISPMVTAGAGEARRAPAGTAAPAPAQANVSPRTSAPPPASPAPASSVEPRTAPAAGMVWVNTATKVFHRQGDPWYGRTKEGKFMTEADAVKAGYRASKQGAAKK